MPQTLRHFLLLFVLLPQLALASLGNGFVLCFAPGEHLVVELASSACCSDELGGTERFGDTLGDESLERDPSTPPPACPACEDLEVSIEPLHPERDSVRTLAPPIALVGLAQWTLSRQTDVLRPRPPLACSSRALEQLRTIVIRC